MDTPSSPLEPDTPPPRKRSRPALSTRRSDDNVEDSENDPEVGTLDFASAVGNANMEQWARKLAQSSRLTPEQADRVVSFSRMVSLQRDIELLVWIMEVGNEQERMVISQPPFEVPADTDKNIEKYALCVFASAKILSFKGAVPSRHVEDMIKRHRFGLPPRIEKNAAAWAKVLDRITYHLTQLRAAIKKAIVASVMVSEVDNNGAKRLVERPPAQQQTLYNLTKTILGDDLSVTAAFSSRVAVMRAVYLEGGESRQYWDRVDKRLEWLRTNAKGDAKRLQRALKAIVQDDQKAHGSEPNRAINEVPDEFQQGVDEELPGDAV
ncbi:hypothetical protein PUNSTDRAFT_41614 [Punctularia strigosozonata HHB-11173 SS5]|uniref:uncharacterized protein n=1 Tax=Punctularia strigosozonata (strain HHB-11173) TaxID=741275 RepID=UPI0004417ABB|nr:uncharacterized protein PUNSTDRAFT_41614 [Punctularia strigosozonata HHB-11173 SS5]EIN14383.1 hypothetical protein PUNSTDRAFT_41614 [Punctularia strigosozonata HHB-11173 SS5]